MGSLTSCRSALVFAIQAWLNETPTQVASGKQPAYFSIAMSGAFYHTALTHSVPFS
ncbi:hypothetical protein L211DRAFT_794156 [Terfezia boudieri ATCC MYA-4762]|uniref:Uncharacterized protein n=1 Tax=Terfezia boudieri ATCC MYA-4762 TaxID=1051890 RepID=A0A3N4L977_9PEZI|nr:hypothetical protein L211DRAFT_794156 [Terfezia boudieri ATCC MYA-4762]